MKSPKNLVIKKISKIPNLTILLLLKDGPKRWSELEKKINKKYVSLGTQELVGLGMIEATIIHDTPTGSKAYQLTPLGKKIVQHIEEMEREFEEYQRKRSFPDTVEEFIDKELEEE